MLVKMSKRFNSYDDVSEELEDIRMQIEEVYYDVDWDEDVSRMLGKMLGDYEDMKEEINNYIEKKEDVDDE